MIDPLEFRPDYPVESVRRSAGFVGLQDEEDVFVLVICTVAASPARPTANYLAPIGVGSTSRVGAQVILHETGLSSAEPL